MVNFGRKLLESQHAPWKDHYLDYHSLKEVLNETKGHKGQTCSERIEAMEAGEPTATSAIFVELLERQIEKVVLFLLHQQGEVADRLAELRDIGKAGMPEIYRKYQQVGEAIVQLVNFVQLNVTGLRKILKKHDKLFHSSPITDRYVMQHHKSEIDTHLQQLYHYGGIAALTETLRQGLLDLERDPYNPVQTTYSSLRRSISFVGEEKHPILHKIHAARRHLKQSSGYAQAMAVQAFIVDADSDINDSMHYEYIGKNGRQGRQFSDVLNLLSSFLFMTNYYIVAPTSGDYAARLGMSEALAGVIIGMTPCAAMVASVLYSWWSNHSYKDALLFSAACAMLGDILYALALPFNSVTLILVGRLLNGFGGARAINRRYIADAFSRTERTAASAAFVTASALGMAAGPALAVAANLTTPQNPLDSLWWTVETAPGYIMFFLWLAYLITCWMHFKEPARKGKETHFVHSVNDKTPLLNGAEVIVAVERATRPAELTPLWKNVPAMATLINCFVLKMVLECLMSSTATITTLYFHWNVTRSGGFLACLGLLMFPANMSVARLSRMYEDRDIILGTLGLMLVGTIGIISYSTSHYSRIQYMVCYIFVFVGANMLEGPNMSLLSKTLPRRWAKGTFNSGLLTTEAGTFGRVVGDVVISGVGLMGLEHVLDLTFIPLSFLVAVTLLTCWKLYPQLEETDEDDD